jgi:threonine synthase
MSFATNLRCRECHREYPLTATHVCEFCFGPLEVTYDYDAIKKNVTRERIAAAPSSLWRYRDFLPCDSENAVEIGAGFTPLIHARTWARPRSQPLPQERHRKPHVVVKDRVVTSHPPRA